ncbi:hypothetical protein LV164_001707 [Aspergillus fumigatus]|nr:hypothetical protein KXX42_002890 [Aspergillus fumigatus]KAH1541177.1 hypothetical protein KXX57_006488 [Aspergillus fumigatus]KAH1981460.1 hypothetical protein KXW88_005721 [Aspergillus fumigatus]KAH2313284.1 hypothetical protein KXV47_003384 [Aspergillus fumigatus]KAH2661661.1 hypothetical protein KXV32_000399 [Aspergillus fumigatus]
MAESQRLVLSTPELLENILLYLDVQSLLTSAQRVCRSWTRLIQTSLRLQQALFFQPIPPEKCREKLLNPLLAKHFWNFFPPARDPSGVRECTYLLLSGPEASERRQKLLRCEASWRRMLVQQPPASLAYVQATHTRGGWIFKHYYLPCDAAPTTHWVHGQVQMDLIGLRMNMLYDLVFESLLGGLRRHWICWEAHMPPQFGPLVYLEEFMPLVEQAIQEADVVVIDHWRTIGAVAMPFTSSSSSTSSYFADRGPEAEQGHPVGSGTGLTPNLPIETLERAGSDVSRVYDGRSNLLSAFRSLQYPFLDWGVKANSTRVSGLACLELREEKFIPREQSSDEMSDDEE